MGSLIICYCHLNLPEPRILRFLSSKKLKRCFEQIFLKFLKIQPEDSEENSLVTSLVRCLKEFARGHRVDQTIGSH